ncbi:histidinol dehydrogenase [Phyllobacterium sp. 0TCS1.6C]|uniref:histidinol dehydrogenase n=1 Tax=unclassified Phyllobacterium TaxID=2638441 RepID=UPI002264362C|nr:MULTISPECIES: histidinol dehydrogenase [unclassified Phyllobacterium]MCX8282580.1 histidinol dehydrogenase [Phyllobacterium sp. 0TCS1.6C]MCX8292488.1 histidinol dehydrogenase [Phyllobacterium sp. 0TCS1.6A]
MTHAIALHDLAALTAEERNALLLRAEDDLSYFLERVPPIIEAVRREGDEALVRFAREFDGVTLDPGRLAVEESEFDEAFKALDAEMIETLEYSADNIRRFHAAQLPGDMWMKEIRPGVLVGERYTPIDSAALYSPRGKGSFPSVTLMTAIPAIVAGVKLPIILTPPGPDGKVDAATLVAARIAGVEKVFRVGGAQAVAAAAFGTASIPRCHKIEGPGSPWFLAGKRLLQGKIASRLPAGPSEIIILADETTDPRMAALDLLIESEHGPDSSAFLVTWDRDFAEKVRQAIPAYWEKMSSKRAGFSATVLGGSSGGIVIASSRQEAYDFVNDYAPEHLQILSKQPFDHLSEIRNASEILLGEYAPGSIANYMMGPNCVLPTSGAAHVHSPLGVHDFMKSASIGHMTAKGYAEMAPHTHRFATYEGFDAHANAVSGLRNFNHR